jgi:hypothetical protein
MSWFEVITDRGRALNMVVVRFERGELHVSVYGLQDGEGTAVLIDHLRNAAYLVADPDTCARVLLQNHYELVSSETLSMLRIARSMANECKTRFVRNDGLVVEAIGTLSD